MRKSRERARERELSNRKALREIEEQRESLVATVSNLRSNLRLLLRAFFESRALTPIETAWVQTIVRSNSGMDLAAEATLT